jgi:hypothetical protein
MQKKAGIARLNSKELKKEKGISLPNPALQKEFR